MLTPRGTTFRDSVDQEAEAAGVRLKIHAEVDGMLLLASLAYEGFGPALLPAQRRAHLGHRHVEDGARPRPDPAHGGPGHVSPQRACRAGPGRPRELARGDPDRRRPPTRHPRRRSVRRTHADLSGRPRSCGRVDGNGHPRRQPRTTPLPLWHQRCGARGFRRDGRPPGGRDLDRPPRRADRPDLFRRRVLGGRRADGVRKARSRSWRRSPRRGPTSKKASPPCTVGATRPAPSFVVRAWSRWSSPSMARRLPRPAMLLGLADLVVMTTTRTRS